MNILRSLEYNEIIKIASFLDVTNEYGLKWEINHRHTYFETHMLKSKKGKVTFNFHISYVDSDDWYNRLPDFFLIKNLKTVEIKKHELIKIKSYISNLERTRKLKTIMKNVGLYIFKTRGYC